MFTLVLLSTIWILYKGIHVIYLFQIKEYRFDRFLTALQEKGMISVGYGLRIRRPAITVRNTLLVSIHLGICTTLFLYAFENAVVYQTLSALFPVAPLVSFVLVGIGVLLTQIPVSLYRSYLILRARQKVLRSDAVFIGITGSYGKTSVKEYLFHILSQKYRVAKTDQNMNTDVGVALSILRNLKQDSQYFIAEFGAYRRGEIHNASWYIPLTYGILTGLGNQHLALYGSREALEKEETELLYILQKQGRAYINGEVPNREELKNNLKANQVWYRADAKADIYLSTIQQKQGILIARVHRGSLVFPIVTSLLGKHSLTNLLPGIALALDLGMQPHEVQQAIKSLTPITGKLSLHKGFGKALVIHDGVNTNREGFLAAIDTLHAFPEKNKIIVSQGIIELGAEKRSTYEGIIQKLINTHVLLFTTDPVFTTIKNTDRIMTFNDVNTLKNHLLSKMNRKTVVLIEGKFPEKFITQIIPQAL